METTRNTKNRNMLIIAAIILAIVVIGTVSHLRGEQTIVGTQPIKIGSLSALTGTGAPIGTEERNGAELAIEEINAKGGVKGRPLQLVAEDLGFDNLKLGSTIAAKLITVDKVSAIVGAQWDDPTDAVLPTIESMRVPMVAADVTNNVEKDTDYDYFFSTWYDNRSGIRKLLSFARSKGLKKIAIIRPIDGGFWKFTADLVQADAAEYGITIIDDVKLSDPFTVDYRTILTKLRAEKPDAIFIVVTDPTQCPFMKQVKELGLNVPILGTEASGSYSSLEACGSNLENLYFSTPAHTASYDTFEASYVKKFGRKPQYPSAVTAYDAVGVIASALDASNLATGDALRAAIASTKDYNGASLGSVTLDKKGYMETPDAAWEVDTVKNNMFETAYQ